MEIVSSTKPMLNGIEVSGGTKSPGKKLSKRRSYCMSIKQYLEVTDSNTPGYLGLGGYREG
jgi:hypothetical protein